MDAGEGIGPARTRISKNELQSYYLEPTTCIAEAVQILVILMGGNRDVNRLEDIVNQTPISYLSMARPLLAEPYLANKFKADCHYKPVCVSGVTDKVEWPVWYKSNNVLKPPNVENNSSLYRLKYTKWP